MQIVLFAAGAVCGAAAFYGLMWLMACTEASYWPAE
jgi:hypothetical protein